MDDRTAREHLTPDERRTYLRAFADRMLIKVTSTDDPDDMPGIERAVRVVSVIERLYSRCDRAEAQAPDPGKLESERARHAVDAIEQRVVLAKTLKWGEARRKDQGHWWDDAKEMAQNQAPMPVQAPLQAPVQPPIPDEAQAVPQDAGEHATVSPSATLPTCMDIAAIEEVAPVTAPPPSLTPVMPGVRYIDYIASLSKAHTRPGWEGLPKTALTEPKTEPPPPRP